jgi:hypothetical protein
MPSYWPDKPHNPAYRGPLEKLFHHLYMGLYRFCRRRLRMRALFLLRIWNEHEVYRILKVFARQQVHGFVANPEGGDPIWSLDAPEDVQENRYPVNTCLLRGWIEEFKMGNQSYKGFPIAQPLLAPGQTFDSAFSNPPYYRLTTAGWNALYRSYAISRVAIFLSAAALTISLANFLRQPLPPSLNVSFPTPSAPAIQKTSPSPSR